jgi:hypothetical protein
MGEPCWGLGTKVNIDQAREDMASQVLVSHSDLANEAYLSGIWECPGGVAWLTYSSGVSVTTTKNAFKDPASVWKNLAEQDPSFTFVGVVRGQPASLVDPAKAPADSDVAGGVEVVDDGLLITVTGNGEIALDDLVEVTESLS